jgi:hypothetical protein
MRPAQYFDRRTGRELSEREALRDGVLRDGVSLRVRMHATDSARTFWDANRDSLVVTDADATASSGNRPGWRLADTDFGRAARDAAYKDYEAHTTSAWKSKAQRDADTVCPDCNGDGDIDGEDCERCDGSGELDDDDDNGDNGKRLPLGEDDRRTVTVDAMSAVNDVHAMSAAHQQNMQRLYDAEARALSEKWKQGKP